jgi:hypothetical protein
MAAAINVALRDIRFVGDDANDMVLVLTFNESDYAVKPKIVINCYSLSFVGLDNEGGNPVRKYLLNGFPFHIKKQPTGIIIRYFHDNFNIIAMVGTDLANLDERFDRIRQHFSQTIAFLNAAHNNTDNNNTDNNNTDNNNAEPSPANLFEQYLYAANHQAVAPPVAAAVANVDPEENIENPLPPAASNNANHLPSNEPQGGAGRRTRRRKSRHSKKGKRRSRARRERRHN